MNTNEMNRNEKFEWKKQIVRDMTKNGAKVMDMAKRLNMGEAEMYAFLSRNFGGVRKLRESIGLPRDIKQVEYVMAAEAAKKEPQLVKVNTKLKDNYDFGNSKPNFNKNIPNFANDSKSDEDFHLTDSDSISGIIQSQRERLMNEFRETLRSDMAKVFEELKEEVVEGFKQDLVNELSKI